VQGGPIFAFLLFTLIAVCNIISAMVIRYKRSKEGRSKPIQ
jgi:hypothetical protein